MIPVPGWSMVIPPELIANPGAPLMITALLIALGVVWKLYRSADDECNQLKDGRAADQKEHARLMTEQMVLNVKSTASIEFKDYVISQHQEQRERCERELDRLRERPVQGQGA